MGGFVAGERCHGHFPGIRPRPGGHLLVGREQGEKTVPGHRRKEERCNQVTYVPAEKPGHSGNIKVARGTEQITHYENSPGRSRREGGEGRSESNETLTCISAPGLEGHPGLTVDWGKQTRTQITREHRSRVRWRAGEDEKGGENRSHFETRSFGCAEGKGRAWRPHSVTEISDRGSSRGKIESHVIDSGQINLWPRPHSQAAVRLTSPTGSAGGLDRLRVRMGMGQYLPGEGGGRGGGGGVGVKSR